MGMGGGGPHSRRRNGTSADRAERPKVRADRSERGQERGERDKSRTKHTRSQASSNSAGSSESGESSKGSSSRTTNSVEMVDGFALFVLAIQDNLRAKLKKAKSGGHVSDQSLFSELRRLWEEMGEEQQLEWQSQANNMPSSLSGSHDGSSLNEDEDSSSQDSSAPSAADRSGSASSFPFRKSTKPTAPAGSTLSIARAAAERLEPEAAATQVGANLNKNESAEMTPASAAMPNFLKQQEPGWQHFPATAVQSPAVRSSIVDSSQQQPQQNSFASGVSLAQAAREAALSSMSMEERMNIAEAAGRANVPLSLLGSIHGLGGVGAAAGLDHVLQLQRQQQHVADMHSLYGLRAPAAAQYVVMNSSLHGLQNAGLQTAGSLLPVHLQTLHEAQSCHLPSMILPSSTLTSQNSHPQQPSSLHASTLQQIVGARDPCVLGSNQVAGGQLPSAHAHGLMYMPLGMSDGHSSHLSTLQDAAHSLSVQHAAQQRAAPALGSTGGSQSSTQAWLHAGGMHIDYSAFAMQSQQHMAAHLQQQHLGAAGKRSLFETPERSGVRPTPEPPQVRTMTFVCDLFSPHEGQISLPVLADSCNIVTSGFGIVGLSCQLSSAEGTRVVKRGQVKDARRHFAHQAQLRLSLARSPNLSVKVFSTGRLQIAGCHDETSCMEAVKIVAQALNEIFRKDPLIMKRQVKSGEHVGATVEGEIDLGKLPSPKIVMINCSFDSGMAALGYALDPNKLTQVLHSLQAKCNNIEEVSYNPDQRYTGVKVKFKPSTISEAAATSAASSGSSSGTAGRVTAEAGDTSSSTGSSREGGVKCGGQELAFTTAQQGEASDTREIFIGMFPSGKAVITGAVRWEEVRQSYEFARAVLCALQKAALTRPVAVQTRTDRFDYLKVPIAAGGSAGRKKAKRAGGMTGGE